MTRGQLPKAYLRIDPNIDRHKADTQWAFIRLLCEANRQPRRGRFKSRAYFDGLLGKATAKRLLAAGDAIEMATGEVLVPGWEEWQEGDVTVAERQRRIRQRREGGAKLTESVDIQPISTSPGGNGAREHASGLNERDSAVTSPLLDRIPTPQAPTPLSTTRDRGRPKGGARRGEAGTQKESPSGARAKPAKARSARTSSGSRKRKPPADRPDLAAYAARGWRWSDAQADDLRELAWQLEVTTEAGLAVLAEWIRTAPADVPDLHGYILELGNRTKAERLAQHSDEDEAWERTKAAYRDEPLPVALGKAVKPMARNGNGVDHAKAVAMLRELRGTVAEGPWRELLERYHVTQEELDAV